MKQLMFGTCLLLLATLHTQAQQQEVFTVDGKAIKGYDPVAFFKVAMPVKGIDSFSYTYKGAQWQFCSRENLEAFKANPEAYAPQYGGYCAYGTAEGHKAPTQTDTWTIINNKLYFNYNNKVKQSWLKDTTQLIEKADRQWPAVKAQ